jgi:hypothetical protein
MLSFLGSILKKKTVHNFTILSQATNGLSHLIGFFLANTILSFGSVVEPSVVS